MAKRAHSPVDPVADYSKSQSREHRDVCAVLRAAIDKGLPNVDSRIYYCFPVWFIDDIPIVGYKATAKHVTLLFWSGQSFGEQNLGAAGKYRAAQIAYRTKDRVDLREIDRWLRKARAIIWDYTSLPRSGVLIRHQEAVPTGRRRPRQAALDRPGSPRASLRRTRHS